MNKKQGYLCAVLTGALAVLAALKLFAHPDGCLCPGCRAKRIQDEQQEEFL